ncbi:macrolide ABC transporter ATP-binding protein [Candidatus Gottesmanbacteria bacterium RBG_16_52_11]|uniref:Macrolide ABC transporter ATP-binding protein n=1 Tax=Candidatus Gottesmanbacteria bacterium RBG_16_52_11 TaxID=1798374 RepID=A0A1F5YMT7_9BACT|nr:MAG: macrolide ABC transporter ATP-binding protein [Candidatus Gottesmanbacteria bacterium RBG_16_52_11]
MAEEILRIDNVSKEYRMDGITFRALCNVSLRIAKGEFLAIMGPSGSGKSTLMHIIGCLDRPTEGKVYIENRDISDAGDQELAKIRNTYIGFVFQQFNLLRRTSTVDNVELPLVYSRTAPGVRKSKAKSILEKVGLGDKLRNFPSQLSGGQQQRVAIARALVTDPKIILADEPTGNLDSKSGHEIMEILNQLHREGHTIVLVTHDANVARYAKRTVRMIDGTIVSKAGKT